MSISPEQLLEAPLAAALLDLLQPAAPARGGALEDVAQELHARFEGQAGEGVDAQRLEQAARHVEVLLVGRRVAAQGDALGPDVERVGPFVDRRDARPEHDVAPVGVVALGLVGLHDALVDLGVGGLRLGQRRRERERPVAEREHHVLGAPDEVRVLVVEDEVRRILLALQPADAHRHARAVPVQALLHDARLGEDLRDAGVVLALRGAHERREAAVRPGVELGEGRPVGREEVRLGLRAQHGLAEVVGELLVRADRVVGRPVDRDLLGLEAQVDRGGVDDQASRTRRPPRRASSPGGRMRARRRSLLAARSRSTPQTL